MKANRKQKIFRLFFTLAMALVMVAGTAAFAAAAPKDKTPHLVVMTRNLYLGADIFKVVEAAQVAPDTIPFVVAEVYNTMLYTNFWVRAEAIADEIAENQPHIVGLQEVSTFYIQTPGDFINGNSEVASHVVIDFYEVLHDALLARGMEYEAFTVTNADVELPMVDFISGLSDVRMVDRDMVLVKKGLDAVPVHIDNYSNNLSLDLGGVNVAFTRGFLIVDVDVAEQSFRFVNTHLEVRGGTESIFRIVQDAQMQELIGYLGYYSTDDPKPVIMVGDFNSSPEDVPGSAHHPNGSYLPYVPPYMQAVTAGYLDAWRLQRRNNEVYTSGFDEYVSDRTAKLTSRIDLIFVDPKDLLISSVKCDVVGNKVPDMVPNPIAPKLLWLWPSDHAGVVGKFIFN